MTLRSLVLLALLLPPVAAEVPLPSDPSVAAHVLATSRKELKVARDKFRDLSPDERGVVKKARDAVANTGKWRALAPALGAAADLLERAATEEEGASDLLANMAKSYRAMAEDVDKDASYLTEELTGTAPAERADATLAAAEKLLANTEDGKPESLAWERVRRLDPRYHALATNMRTLSRGFAALGEKERGKAAATIAKAAKVHEALEPYFAGVLDPRSTDDAPGE